jgi:hypothetical protein
VALQGKLFAISGLPPALIRVVRWAWRSCSPREDRHFRLVGLFKGARHVSRASIATCTPGLALATGIVIVAAA